MQSAGFKLFALLACVFNGACLANAADTVLNLTPEPGHYAYSQRSDVMLASNADDAIAKGNIAPARANDDFHESLFTGNKVHKYLGLGTLAAVLATTMTAPDGNCDSGCNNSQNKSGTHQTLGRVTGALALATVATGLIFHWNDMHLMEDGLRDPDTQHWLLGGAGALILANAVTKAPARSHAAQAEVGAAMMLLAVKLAW